MEVKVGRNVLDANDAVAAGNRELFSRKGILVVNLMSSPGSGKTTILEKTLGRIRGRVPAAVIVGDVCTRNDADRLARCGAPAIQVNTDRFGGSCHLSASMVRNAADRLALDHIALLIVENVGNLVCPAEFDIGERFRGVVLSVTEGEDKPLKYPAIFRGSDFALLNKIDLLPHLEFDRDAAVANIRAVNPGIRIFETSARTEEGFGPWIEWIEAHVTTFRADGGRSPAPPVEGGRR